MNNEQIEELKKLAEAATPGPWEQTSRTVYVLEHHGWRKGVEQFRNRFSCTMSHDGSGIAPAELEANAHFIAAANPAAVLELIKDRNQQERMFLAACDDLAAIADDLGIDSNIEGGAAPILREIAALRAARKS